MSENSFNAKDTLESSRARHEIFRLDALQPALRRRAAALLAEGAAREPAAHRGDGSCAADIGALAGWDPEGRADRRDRLHPRPASCCRTSPAFRRSSTSRRCATRSPRSAATRRINPLTPAELVIDHSVQVDAFATPRRSRERRARVRAQPRALRVPALGPGARSATSRSSRRTPASSPGQPRVPRAGRLGESAAALAYPDTLVGTDSHTTMVNGLGVLGWGVGGIEAEAAMLGQPLSMLLPQVVGFRLHGELPEGATATDLVLTVTEILAPRGVVGQFVEFFGEGLAACRSPTARRSATCRPSTARPAAIFPIDAETLRYLRFRAARRSRSSWSRPTPASRACGTTARPRSRLLRQLELDLGDGRAEPRRAQAPPGPGPADRAKSVPRGPGGYVPERQRPRTRRSPRRSRLATRRPAAPGRRPVAAPRPPAGDVGAQRGRAA